MKCEKCGNDFPENVWESGKTYDGIDIHHNPPQFMFEENDSWKGELLNLCRKCHRELHDKILEIMFKHSNLFKPKKSEYWTWISIIGEDRIKCREEVYNFTKKWLEENGSTDSKTA